MTAVGRRTTRPVVTAQRPHRHPTTLAVATTATRAITRAVIPALGPAETKAAQVVVRGLTDLPSSGSAVRQNGRVTEQLPDPASAYLDVRIEWQKDGRLWLGTRNLMGALLDIGTLGIFGGTAQARSTVQVVRKRDGEIVAQFEHTNNVQAMEQVDDLRYRLENRSIGDMCAQLGISRAEI